MSNLASFTRIRIPLHRLLKKLMFSSSITPNSALRINNAGLSLRLPEEIIANYERHQKKSALKKPVPISLKHAINEVFLDMEESLFGFYTGPWLTSNDIILRGAQLFDIGNEDRWSRFVLSYLRHEVSAGRMIQVKNLIASGFRYKRIACPVVHNYPKKTTLALRDYLGLTSI